MLSGFSAASNVRLSRDLFSHKNYRAADDQAREGSHAKSYLTSSLFVHARESPELLPTQTDNLPSQ